MTCLGICTLTIFAPERMFACITSNGLSVSVFLLTDLLFGIPPSSDHVLEYCTVVWHHGLRCYQTEATETIQRRAIHIIYPVTTSMPYCMGGVAVC